MFAFALIHPPFVNEVCKLVIVIRLLFYLVS